MGAGAGADTGSGADRKLLNKLTRQLLRGLVQDVQPRRELRNTKLWVIAELPGCRDSGSWAGACPVGFAVKRNVDVELLRRRANTVCEILIGADEEQEQEQQQQASAAAAAELDGETLPSIVEEEGEGAGAEEEAAVAPGVEAEAEVEEVIEPATSSGANDDEGEGGDGVVVQVSSSSEPGSASSSFDPVAAAGI